MSTINNFVLINVGRMKGFMKISMNTPSLIKWDSGLGKGTLTNQAFVMALSPNLKYIESDHPSYAHYKYMLQTNTNNAEKGEPKEKNEELARVFQLRDKVGGIRVDKSCLIIEYENNKTSHVNLAITFIDPLAINRSSNNKNIVNRTFISMDKKDLESFYEGMAIYMEDRDGNKMTVPGAIDEIKEKIKFFKKEQQSSTVNNTEGSSPYTDKTSDFYYASRKEINDFIELAIQSEKEKLPGFILSSELNKLDILGHVTSDKRESWIKIIKDARSQVESSPKILVEQRDILTNINPRIRMDDSKNIELNLVAHVERALRVTDDQLDNYEAEKNKTKRELAECKKIAKEIANEREEGLKVRTSRSTHYEGFRSAFTIINESFPNEDFGLKTLSSLNECISTSEMDKTTTLADFNSLKDKIDNQQAAVIKAEQDFLKAEQNIETSKENITIHMAQINKARNSMTATKKIAKDSPHEIERLVLDLKSLDSIIVKYGSKLDDHYGKSKKEREKLQEKEGFLKDREGSHRDAKDNLIACRSDIDSCGRQIKDLDAINTDLKLALDNKHTYGNTTDPRLLRIRFFTNKTTFLAGVSVNAAISKALLGLFGLLKKFNLVAYDLFFEEYDPNEFGQNIDIKSEINSNNKKISQLNKSKTKLENNISQLNDREEELDDPDFLNQINYEIEELKSNIIQIDALKDSDTIKSEEKKRARINVQKELDRIQSKTPEQLLQDSKDAEMVYGSISDKYSDLESSADRISGELEASKTRLNRVKNTDNSKDINLKKELESLLKSHSLKNKLCIELVAEINKTSKSMDVTEDLKENEESYSVQDMLGLFRDIITNLDTKLDLLKRNENECVLDIDKHRELLETIKDKLNSAIKTQKDISSLKSHDTYRQSDSIQDISIIDLDDETDASLLYLRAQSLIKDIQQLKSVITTLDTSLSERNHEAFNFGEESGSTLFYKFERIISRLDEIETRLQTLENNRDNTIANVSLMFKDIINSHEKCFQEFGSNLRSIQKSIKNNSTTTIGNRMELIIENFKSISKGMFNVPKSGNGNGNETDNFFDIIDFFFKSISNNNNYMFNNLSHAQIETFTDNIRANWDTVGQKDFEEVLLALIEFDHILYIKNIRSIILNNTTIKSFNSSGVQSNDSSGQGLALVSKLSIYLLSKSKVDIENFPFVVDEPSGSLSSDVLEIKNLLQDSNFSAILTQNEGRYSNEMLMGMYVHDSQSLIKDRLWVNRTTFNKQVIIGEAG